MSAEVEVARLALPFLLVIAEELEVVVEPLLLAYLRLVVLSVFLDEMLLMLVSEVRDLSKLIMLH